MSDLFNIMLEWSHTRKMVCLEDNWIDISNKPKRLGKDMLPNYIDLIYSIYI